MVVATPSTQAHTEVVSDDSTSTPSPHDIERECESIRAEWTETGNARKTRVDSQQDRIFRAHLAFARLLVSME